MTRTPSRTHRDSDAGPATSGHYAVRHDGSHSTGRSRHGTGKLMLAVLRQGLPVNPGRAGPGSAEPGPGSVTERLAPAAADCRRRARAIAAKPGQLRPARRPSALWAGADSEPRLSQARGLGKSSSRTSRTGPASGRGPAGPPQSAHWHKALACHDDPRSDAGPSLALRH